MTDFQAMLKHDAINVFLNEFAEDVTYTPVNPTVDNPARTIRADVVRDPPMPIKANDNWTAPKMLVRVANDPVFGIDSATMDTGGDTITVAYRIGTTPKAFLVRLPQSGEMQDPGMLMLELK